MDRQLEKMLLNAGQCEPAYDRETWYKIVDAVLDDFRNYIGQDFEPQEKQDIGLEIEDALDPCFNTWISSPKEATTDSLSPSQFWLDLINHELLQIEDNSSRSKILWEAVVGGQMAGSYWEDKELFYASATIFFFDPISEKRLSLENGKSIVDVTYYPQSDGTGKWMSLGWIHDAYYEWKYIEYFSE